MKNIPFTKVEINDSLWKKVMDVNRTSVLPFEYEQCRKTGRIDVWKLKWKKVENGCPHIFWDSDLAKWIEAAAYTLMLTPDKALEKQIDDIVDMMEKAQMPDGYLNSYFISVEPENRWTNLKDRHELYCAGHLMEAAVAYFQATGKRKFLDIICRFADCIDRTFGREKGKKRGYCGHEEIELALVKLYKATGEKRYLNLAKYFVDERGQSPNYFDVELEKLAIKPNNYGRGHEYYQAKVPVREQTEAEGHSVRACYLYTGMADVAAETGDKSLLEACRKLWQSIVKKRMYLTGGIGSARDSERFSFDYDLPNAEAYAETCAAIALFFFAHRMLHADNNSEYADIMETLLYNGIMSGISTDGKSYFYENPLQVLPEKTKFYRYNHGSGETTRREWFGCSCCPPNIARLIASLGDYLYSVSENELRLNLYAGSVTEAVLGGVKTKFVQTTSYPWDETVTLKVSPEKAASFAVLFRLPSWCRKASMKVNGKNFKFADKIKDGFIRIERVWKKGDTVEFNMSMPVEFIYAHPCVVADSGKAAVQRGPVVYCFEEADNGKNLSALFLDTRKKAELSSFKVDYIKVPAIKLEAERLSLKGWENSLYSNSRPEFEKAELKAIPYFLWANRGTGEMTVWVNYKR